MRRRKRDTVGGVVEDLVNHGGTLNDLVMVFVPGDQGKGYRSIRRVKVETCTAPDGSAFRRIILYANKEPGS